MGGDHFKILGRRWIGAACLLALIIPSMIACRDKPLEQAYVPKAYAQRMNREAITLLYANKPLEALELVNKAIEFGDTS